MNGTSVYAGGYFQYIGGHWRGNVAEMDAATGVASAWNPNASDGVLAVAASGPVVYMGGEFRSVGTLPHSYLVVTATAVLAVPDRPDGRGVALLRPNEPNPFRARTAVRFWLAAPEKVTLKLYDVCGREVATLLDNERRGPGAHQLEFDGRGLPAGVYLCRLRAGRAVASGRMIRVR